MENKATNDEQDDRAEQGHSGLPYENMDWDFLPLHYEWYRIIEREIWDNFNH